MDDYNSRRLQIAERALIAKLGLWTALLTAHTILLSVAIALLVTVKPPAAWPFKWSGFIAIFCMVVLLLIFVLTKSQYEQIGQRLAAPGMELSDSERTQELRNANLRRSLSAVSEVVAILGLGVEAALLGWVLAAS